MFANDGGLRSEAYGAAKLSPTAKVVEEYTLPNDKIALLLVAVISRFSFYPTHAHF